jgi:glycosyltransferase involved in cell wall biosynthesis
MSEHAGATGHGRGVGVSAAVSERCEAGLGGRPIRVLHLLVTTSPGGGPKHVFDLVRHLSRDEFEVMVAAPRDGVFFDRFGDLGVTMVELPLSRLGLRHVALTARLIRRHRIDVVHTHGKGPGLYGRLAARALGVPAVHTFHGIHYTSYPRPGQWLYLALERRLSRLTHTIINVSRSQEAEGLALRLFRPEQSAVVVNGIDVEELDRAIGQSSMRREMLGLGADDFVLGCVSRWDPVKRFEILLDAVRRLAGRLSRLVLLLVGGGGEEARIRRLVARTGLRDRVIFTGFLGNPARVYGILDVYVATSLKEGLPLAPLEAMSARLPVIATDVPGHRDVVVHGQTGLLVPPEDSAALASAIAALGADVERRRAMGAAGRRRVLDQFGIQSMARQTAEVYRATLDPRGERMRGDVVGGMAR